MNEIMFCFFLLYRDWRTKKTTSSLRRTCLDMTIELSQVKGPGRITNSSAFLFYFYFYLLCMSSGIDGSDSKLTWPSKQTK